MGLGLSAQYIQYVFYKGVNEIVTVSSTILLLHCLCVYRVS